MGQPFRRRLRAFAENFNVVYWPGLPWGLNAAPDLDMTREEWMDVATQKNDPKRDLVWTGLYFDPTANDWMVSAEQPVDQDGRHLATLGLDILLNDLFQRVFDDHLAGTKNFIIRPDGRLVAHPDKVKELAAAKGVLDVHALRIPGSSGCTRRWQRRCTVWALRASWWSMTRRARHFSPRHVCTARDGGSSPSIPSRCSRPLRFRQRSSSWR
ncbi:MAG: hypothetical protein WDO68_10780 [Gammaproteobacteria bacterium]